MAFGILERRILAQPAKPTTVIHGEALEGSWIDPKLFGNFIELLDDVVPGMWAEMLNDRSFEGVTKLAPWCYYDGSPDICDREWDTTATWSYDTENPFNAKRSARLTASRKQPASLTQSGLAVKKGMEYTFTGYFRAENFKGSVIARMKTKLPDGSWMVLGSAKLKGISTHWQKCDVSIVSKGETERMVFEIIAEGEGRVWVDEVSLMPVDNMEGWRRDVVEAITEVKPALIRFGGSVCDPGEYRWKNGNGARDRRVPFPNKVWGRLDPNDVGIDEFCEFCQLTHAEPMICVSFSAGPENAADLVEYCNGAVNTVWGEKRMANGHPSYDVKYWQIGNEISGDDENYVKNFGRFVELMKQRDPNVIILSSFPTQKLLDRVGKDIDYIAPHHYTPDLAWCEKDFENLTQMINRTPGCERIQIGVTEWNVSGGDWGLMRGKQMTLGTALLNARYLHVMMRHSDKVKIACRSNMANSFCGAIIETSPAGLLKRPSYYVMQLYAQHELPVPVRIESAGDGVDGFACRAEDASSAVVFLVNSKTEPVEWFGTFESVRKPLRVAKAEAVCDTQDMRQIDVVNHWNALERVKTIALKLAAENKVVLPALSVTAVTCEMK